MNPHHKFSTLVDLLRWRADHQPNQRAYTYLVDGEQEEEHLTYQELDGRAKAIAALLQQKGLVGKQVLLLYPAGLAYITAFFGCLYAGGIAVPAYPPRRKRADPRLEAIATNSESSVALTTTEIMAHRERISTNSSDLQNMLWLDTGLITNNLGTEWQEPNIPSESLAFLQYTSGSTGVPKGVMVSHDNLLHNQSMIHASFNQNKSSLVVGWLPFYHDMGLIGNLLYSLYVGVPYVFMAPAAFVQKPLRWLQAISRYRATGSGGPNFAYELCLERIEPQQLSGLDLSCWEVAFNGAEPIRTETLTRFSERFIPYGFRYEAFHCCYGLAESTLFVTADFKLEQPNILTMPQENLKQGSLSFIEKSDEGNKSLVGVGRNWLDQQIVIVNPETMTICQENQVGEVWLTSQSVAQGYWKRSTETKETFRAYLNDTGEGPFLRSGDLGFVQHGQLYITGRLKDLIIIRGRNHYPQDIERTVEESHAMLQFGGGGAFSIDVDEVEQLIVVQEVKRTAWHQLKIDQDQVDEVIETIRRAVSNQHGVSPHVILLLKPMKLPKTSSGKVRRHACRIGYLQGTLDIVRQALF